LDGRTGSGKRDFSFATAFRRSQPWVKLFWILKTRTYFPDASLETRQNIVFLPSVSVATHQRNIRLQGKDVATSQRKIGKLVSDVATGQRRV
jgi:hypothetical protein